MEYKILRDNFTGLESQVNQHLSEGWELYGHPYSNDNSHFQAMVKGGAQLQTATLESTTPEINIYLPEGFEFQKQSKKTDKPNG